MNLHPHTHMPNFSGLYRGHHVEIGLEAPSLPRDINAWVSNENIIHMHFANKYLCHATVPACSCRVMLVT